MNNSLTELDQLVITRFPYPIATHYQQMLDAPDWRAKVDLALWVFGFGLRTIALGIISEYLIRDADKVSDPRLNELLLKRFPRPSLGTWQDLFFSGLRAYAQKRELVFIQELYDLYWDTSSEPHRERAGIQEPYTRLVVLRNQLAHQKISPSTDAEWRAVGEQILPDLRAVLGQFAFIQNYDLIHITGQRDDQYEYTSYTGAEIKRVPLPLHTAKSLKIGHFYLLKNNNDLLELHPMLIFWQDLMNPDLSNQLSDAAIYDSMTRKVVKYIRLLLDGEVKNESLANDFALVLYETIEKVKQYRRTAKELDWQLLQQVATSIANQRFADVLVKYEKKLYLQREEIRRAFDEFLSAPQTAFLLLGKSGVGKSNFFISLAEEYQDQDQVCLLLYNGAKLETERALVETISRDFNAHLRLVNSQGEIVIQDFLTQIERIKDIQQRKVILFIDAVNENGNATELFALIDKLVSANTYPWFKVVFSSRPEAWKVMRNKVKPSERHYFFLSDKEQPGVELQPFGVEVSRFTRDELPLVYAKYQAHYQLL